MPKITVLMPVYNGEKYLREAIESIINQTFTDFEFIIINDGSTDHSEEIIKSYNDKRIKLVNNIQNMNISKSLNKGINLSKGEYIARMDADDVSQLDRLRIQAYYLDHHLDIDVCGSFFKTFGTHQNRIIHLPIENINIAINLLFRCPIAHPTVMFRRNVIIKNQFYYDSDYDCAEDYELWSRMASAGIKFHNIPYVLLNYRVGHDHVSSVHNKEQNMISVKIMKRNMQRFKIDNDFFMIYAYHVRNVNIQKFKKIWEIFDDIIGQNDKNNFYDPIVFRECIQKMRFNFWFAHRNLWIKFFPITDFKVTFFLEEFGIKVKNYVLNRL